MDKKTFVSVICLSFNHERFIDRAMQSVLNQDYDNFETIVIDDCSTDSTLQILEKYYRPSIKILQNEYNIGISGSLNRGVVEASGDIVCILATDDELYPNHLTKAVRLLDAEQNISAVYARLEVIDEDDVFQQLYYVPTIGRYEILRSMFLEANNHLPAPGSCFRKSLFQSIGEFDTALIQTQDFDFNIRVLFTTDFRLIDTTTVKYRRMRDSSNLSASSHWVKEAFANEITMLLDRFADLCTPEQYNRLFPDESLPIKNKQDVKYQLSMRAINTGNVYCKKWGYKMLSALLRNRENFDYYHRKYNFTFKKYIDCYKTTVVDLPVKSTLRARFSRKIRFVFRKIRGVILLLYFR